MLFELENNKYIFNKLVSHDVENVKYTYSIFKFSCWKDFIDDQKENKTKENVTSQYIKYYLLNKNNAKGSLLEKELSQVNIIEASAPLPIKKETKEEIIFAEKVEIIK